MFKILLLIINVLPIAFCSCDESLPIKSKFDWNQGKIKCIDIEFARDNKQILFQSLFSNCELPENGISCYNKYGQYLIINDYSYRMSLSLGEQAWPSFIQDMQQIMQQTLSTRMCPIKILNKFDTPWNSEVNGFTVQVLLNGIAKECVFFITACAIGDYIQSCPVIEDDQWLSNLKSNLIEQHAQLLQISQNNWLEIANCQDFPRLDCDITLREGLLSPISLCVVQFHWEIPSLLLTALKFQHIVQQCCVPCNLAISENYILADELKNKEFLEFLHNKQWLSKPLINAFDNCGTPIILLHPDSLINKHIFDFIATIDNKDHQLLAIQGIMINTCIHLSKQVSQFVQKTIMCND